MAVLKPIHLRNDEYNTYIQEYKEKLLLTEGALTSEEKNIIFRCGLDYGLIVDEKVGVINITQPQKDYNVVFRIKGPYTLPKQAQFSSGNGTVRVKPFILHELAWAKRFVQIAKDIYEKKLITSVVPIDEEYIYEALRDTAFTIAMEEVIALGPGFQIIQIEFDENGHFKTIELDEWHY